jgi:prepilin-type N-terminal cleavage/methylation domain-containing protein
MESKRVKAFTLVEMIVVMLLTAVVIGLAYEVFQVISKSYSSFSAKNERINDVERLEHWLKRDFIRAENITAGGNKVCMIIGKDTVSYVFTDSVVTRQGLRVDAIRIEVKNITTTFQGKEAQNEPQPLPADELNFDIVLEQEEIPETFYKLYSAEQLITLTHGLDRHQ